MTMTARDDYIGAIRGLVISLVDVLSAEECAEVEHLVDHGEPAEAVRSLAWIIVEEGKFVSADVVSSIEELVRGFIDPADMPANLREHTLQP